VTQKGGPEGFATTRWSQVEIAGDEDSPQRRAALAELLGRYLPALRSHLVKRFRFDADLADDVLQEFIVRKVYQYNLFGHADRKRGKFRTLLLVALDNFAWERVKQERKLREIPESAEPQDTSCPPELCFDVPWARQVLAQSLAAMQENCRADNRPDVWGVFEARLLRPILDDVEPLAYEAIARQFGLGSSMQAANRLVTAKRMFERHLRDIVGGYSPPDQIEEEIADLQRVLATAGQRESEVT
jgi:DNA-directed RNA polymerase specialized sigma24 family protein